MFNLNAHKFFICKLINKEGMHFGEHYMNDQIWFMNGIYVEARHTTNIKKIITWDVKYK